MSNKVKWAGSPITTCNLCKDIIVDRFIDGRLRAGSWAIMCPACHKIHGVGLGIGKGQLYVQENDSWIKRY